MEHLAAKCFPQELMETKQNKWPEQTLIESIAGIAQLVSLFLCFNYKRCHGFVFLYV